MIETEKKIILTYEEYLAIIMKMCKYAEPVIQTNYYFDTENLTMNRKGVTCRIRFKNGKYTAEIKSHERKSRYRSIENILFRSDKFDETYFNKIGLYALTKEEIDFIHSKGCKIAAIYKDSGEKKTEEQGKITAKKIDVIAFELGIPEGTAIFIEAAEGEELSSDFMKGFAAVLLEEGFVPGFKADTDAKFGFDREFSRGLQTDREIFEKCLVWATAPSLKEYDRVTTTHLIHPDNWMPYAPSGITRGDIAVWQYGANCHPINDDAGVETIFNVNLVRDEQIIIEKMF